MTSNDEANEAFGVWKRLRASKEHAARTHRARPTRQARLAPDDGLNRILSLASCLMLDLISLHSDCLTTAQLGHPAQPSSACCCCCRPAASSAAAASLARGIDLYPAGELA